MENQPPPFFKRGPAPVALLSLYVALSVTLLLIDARLQTLEVVRQAISMLTEPIQRVAHLPSQWIGQSAGYLSSVARLQEENAQLKRARLDNVSALLRTEQLEVENERLRKLLGVKERQQASGHVAQILYAARDPFSRRIVIDKGQQDKVAAGQPVIDDAGLVGQVTRVFPFVAEVTLITDKEQAVPVQIVRTGQRSVVFGLGTGQLELRFLPANADVQNGDLLVTSGLDGVFLPGFPVAKVVHIERDTSSSFARIYCLPVAAAENFSEVMILETQAVPALPEQLISEAARREASKPVRGTKRKRR